MDEELFRVVAICKKRALGDVIIALEGITVMRPEVQRMVNVKVKKGGKLHAPTNGNLVSLFAEHVAKAKVESVTPKEVKDWLVAQGKSATSYSYILKGALDVGILRKDSKTKGKYLVRKETK